MSVKEVFKDNREVIGALEQQFFVPRVHTFIAYLFLFQLPSLKACILHPTSIEPVFAYIIMGRAVNMSLVKLCFTEL